jgi:hypothetical protein
VSCYTCSERACPPLTMSGPEDPAVLASAFTPAPRADGASTWAAPEYADPTPGDLRPTGPSAAKRPRLEGDSQGGGAAGAPLVLETEVEVLDGGLVNTYEVQHPLASRDTLCGEGAVALRCAASAWSGVLVSRAWVCAQATNLVKSDFVAEFWARSRRLAELEAQARAPKSSNFQHKLRTALSSLACLLTHTSTHTLRRHRYVTKRARSHGRRSSCVHASGRSTHT